MYTPKLVACIVNGYTAIIKFYDVHSLLLLIRQHIETLNTYKHAKQQSLSRDKQRHESHPLVFPPIELTHYT